MSAQGFPMTGDRHCKEPVCLDVSNTDGRPKETGTIAGPVEFGRTAGTSLVVFGSRAQRSESFREALVLGARCPGGGNSGGPLAWPGDIKVYAIGASMITKIMVLCS